MPHKKSMFVLCFLFGIASLSGCSPKRQYIEGRPSLEDVHGQWRSKVDLAGETTLREVRLFEGGMSVVNNLPVYIPSRGELQNVSSEGRWELFPRESRDSRVQWVVMVQLTNVKMRVPFYLVQEGSQIVLEYSIDPEYARGLEFKRVSK